MSTPQEPDEAPQITGSTPARRRGRGPLTAVLDLFSSVRLGIVLLSVLFVYATVGSAGIVYPALGPGRWNILDASIWRHEMVRQWPVFEMTEFQWFHTGFFNALIALICVNIVVTTLRRIRLTVLSLGVWMIHTGIVTLCVGSVIYFGTKVEGDAPVFRREVVVRTPGAGGAAGGLVLPAVVGASGSSGGYTVRVAQIDPEWELRSEGQEGEKAYALTLEVEGAGRSFMRQLIDGRPQYTEDVLPGRGRVKKLEEFGGKALLDEGLEASLRPRAQSWFWLREDHALYARPAGTRAWSQYELDGLPRYNDRVAEPESDVWATADSASMRARPLDLEVDTLPSAGGGPDVLEGLDVRITGYLRYAVLQDGFEPGDPAKDTLNPMVDVLVRDEQGTTWRQELAATNPARREAFNGELAFRWVASQDEVQTLLKPRGRELRLRVPSTGLEVVVPVGAEEDRPAIDAALIPLGDSGFSYRVMQAVDRLPLADGRAVSLVLVEIQTPEGDLFTRWVFEDPSRNRDNPKVQSDKAHTPRPADPRLESVYSPGSGAAVTLCAGPGEVGLVAVCANLPGGARAVPLTLGAPADVGEGLSLSVLRYSSHARAATKPIVVPQAQRDRDVDSMQLSSLVRVRVSDGGWWAERWIPMHRYVFDDAGEAAPALTRWEPQVFALPDGRSIEVVVGRERRALPHPVVLDDFILTTNVGGFTGRVSSIRDWTSRVRFDEKGELSPARTIKTNDPVSFGGLWFFQSYWDAPRPALAPGDTPSAGLNFTGLGVGNRNGVLTQLAGCVIAVTGMIYAFYVKPMIRRRRREAALSIAAARGRLAPAVDLDQVYAPEPDEAESVGAAGRASPGGVQESRL